MYRSFLTKNKQFSSLSKISSSLQGKTLTENRIKIYLPESEISKHFEVLDKTSIQKIPKLNGFEYQIYADSFENFSKIYKNQGVGGFKFGVVEKNDPALLSQARVVSQKNLNINFPFFINQSGHYEYFINDPAFLNSLIFRGSKDNAIARQSFNYISHGILKRSTNILTIQSCIPINFDDIMSLLREFTINRIINPVYEKGHWKIYVGDSDSYHRLLETPIKFKNEILEVRPFYGHSIQVDSNSRISDKFLFISSLEKIDQMSLLKGLGLPEWAGCLESRYENNYLYTISIPDADYFQIARFSNGNTIDGTVDYLMSFCDEPNITNISTPVLSLNVPQNFDTKLIEKFLPGTKFKYSKENNQIINAYPLNMEEYKKILNTSIRCDNHEYRFIPHFSHFLSLKHILKYDGPLSTNIISDATATLGPSSIKNFSLTDDGLYLQFDPEKFEESFFKMNSSELEFERAEILRRRKSKEGFKHSVLNRFIMILKDTDPQLFEGYDMIIKNENQRVRSFFDWAFHSKDLPIYYYADFERFRESYFLTAKELIDAENVKMVPDYSNLDRTQTVLKFDKFENAYYVKANLEKNNIFCEAEQDGKHILLTMKLRNLEDFDFLISNLPMNFDYTKKKSFDIIPGIDILKI